MPPPDPAPWVHMFTSTTRPQYATDAVTVLGMLDGQHLRFRYERRYVDEGLWADWRDDALVGRRVVVHLSLQHPAEYHPPVLVTLRTGTVVSSATDGATCTVVFSAGPHLPLRESDAEDPEGRRDTVREHTEGLTCLLGGRGPVAGHAAVQGPDPTALSTVEPSADQGAAFQTTVRYVTPVLTSAPHLFVRLLGLRDDEAGKDRPPGGAGRHALVAGRHHTLLLSHYQAGPPPDGVTLRVGTPPWVQPLGPTTFEVGSRYDVLEVPLFVPHRDDAVGGELVVTVDGPLTGPDLRLPLDAGPGAAHTVSGPLLGVAGAALVLLPPVLANPQSTALRIALALAGAGCTGVLLWLRRAKGLTG